MTTYSKAKLALMAHATGGALSPDMLGQLFEDPRYDIAGIARCVPCTTAQLTAAIAMPEPIVYPAPTSTQISKPVSPPQ